MVLVTPYLAGANNGNWRTARRWQQMLRPDFRVIVQTAWFPGAGTPPDAMIALHARRSAGSVRAWREMRARGGLVLCLTGTDLYKDIPDGDSDALASVAAADRLVVLQDDALEALPESSRARARVIFQSARILREVPRAADRLDCIMVGHLRDVKDPLTAMRALGRLPPALPIRLTHVGEALDADLGAASRSFAANEPRYRWLGGLPHGVTRQLIRRAHLLVHPSLMEGGANVIVEAITAGTPVLASRMSGNIGMLGRDYPGYFPVGDDRALAALMAACARDPRTLADLERHARARRPLFAPARERRMLGGAVRSVLG